MIIGGDHMRVYRLPPSVKALIFDIDNTLYSDERYVRVQGELLVERFAARRGVSVETARAVIKKEKERYADAHSGAQTSIGNIMAALGVSLEENALWRDEMFRPEDYLRPDEATAAAIAELSSRFAIAAVTNNTTGVGRRTLAALGIEGLFRHVIGLDSCYKSKPAKEPFELALRLLETAPENSVSVGDRYDVDLDIPLSMGMGGILVERINDLQELPVLLRGRQKQ